MACPEAHPRFGKGGSQSRRRLRGSRDRAPSRHGFLGCSVPVVVLSKKDTRVPPSVLNPPLLASLLVDLRYNIIIFVCRLVVTENISVGQLPPPSGVRTGGGGGLGVNLPPPH